MFSQEFSAVGPDDPNSGDGQVRPEKPLEVQSTGNDIDLSAASLPKPSTSGGEAGPAPEPAKAPVEKPVEAPQLSTNITITKPSRLVDFRPIEQLQKEIWNYPDREIIPDYLLFILAKGSAQILVAQTDKGQAVGFSIGYLARETATGELYIYNDLLGVHPDYRSAGVGFKLLDEANKDALAHGIRRSEGTYDPLESRNAYLYLNHLAYRAVEFFPNYYGSDYASEYEKLGSDRFRAMRYVDEAKNPPPFPKEASELISVQTTGAPVVNREELGKALAHYTCKIPIDFRAVKQADLALAKSWQNAFGEIAATLLDGRYEAVNYRVDKKSGYGEYLFQKK